MSILDYQAEFEKVLAGLRQVNARFIDFSEGDFPSTIGDCMMEFSELEEEVRAIIDPILEAYDELSG